MRTAEISVTATNSMDRLIARPEMSVDESRQRRRRQTLEAALAHADESDRSRAGEAAEDGGFERRCADQSRQRCSERELDSAPRWPSPRIW